MTIQDILNAMMGGTAPNVAEQAPAPAMPSQVATAPSGGSYDPNRAMELALNQAKEMQAAELAKRGVGLSLKEHPFRAPAGFLARIAGNWNESSGNPSPWLRDVTSIENPRFVTDTADATMARLNQSQGLALGQAQENRLNQQLSLEQQMAPILTRLREAQAGRDEAETAAIPQQLQIDRREQILRKRALKQRGLADEALIRQRNAKAAQLEGVDGGFTPQQTLSNFRMIETWKQNALTNLATQQMLMEPEEYQQRLQEVEQTAAMLMQALRSGGVLPEEGGATGAPVPGQEYNIEGYKVRVK